MNGNTSVLPPEQPQALVREGDRDVVQHAKHGTALRRMAGCLVGGLGSLSLPVTVWAQERPSDFWWGMHPMWGMWGAWGFGIMLMMLVFWGLVIVGLVLGVRWLLTQDRDSRPDTAPSGTSTPWRRSRCQGRRGALNADRIATQLVAYLSLREALGFQRRAENIRRPEFVACVPAPGSPGPLRPQTALEGACPVSPPAGPVGPRAVSGSPVGFASTSRLPPQPPRGHPRDGCQPHGDRTPLASHPRSSPGSSRRRTRVVRGEPDAPPPYPP